MRAHAVPYGLPYLPRREIVCAMVALMGLLVAPAGLAWGAMTLDQYNLVADGSIVFDDNQSLAQTFIPSLTGQLAQVDVMAAAQGGLPALVSIQTAPGGTPGGTVLGSAIIPSWASGSWNAVDLTSESVWLTAGQPYAIVLAGRTEGPNGVAVN